MTTKVITRCTFELTLKEMDIIKSAQEIFEQMAHDAYLYRDKGVENAELYEACMNCSELISTIWSSDMVNVE